MPTDAASDDPRTLAGTVRLIDHHCHGVLRTDSNRAELELLATESDWPEPPGGTVFDSPFGVTLRAECAPLLDLPRHVDPETYLGRRLDLGFEEVTRRLLRATGIGTYVVETGFGSDAILDPDGMARLGAAKSLTIVRLERLAEEVADRGTDAAGYADEVAHAISSVARTAAGFKTVMAYRHGLDFDPQRPSAAEVRAAAGTWLAAQVGGAARMDSPVLLRHLVWEAVDRSMPLQVHVGYGDSDIELHRCDPTKMTEFLRRTRTSGTTVLLLHCWPFQREASYLSQVYPHVYLDTGAAVNYTGPGSARVIAESLEMAPFHKVLFSTDAFGLPELYYCGALLWRRGVGGLFGSWVDDDVMSRSDAGRYLTMIASGNAARVYGTGT